MYKFYNMEKIKFKRILTAQNHMWIAYENYGQHYQSTRRYVMAIGLPQSFSSGAAQLCIVHSVIGNVCIKEFYVQGERPIEIYIVRDYVKMSYYHKRIIIFAICHFIVWTIYTSIYIQFITLNKYRYYSIIILWK